jgi:hypothetical protein
MIEDDSILTLAAGAKGLIIIIYLPSALEVDSGAPFLLSPLRWQREIIQGPLSLLIGESTLSAYPFCRARKNQESRPPRSFDPPRSFPLAVR